MRCCSPEAIVVHGQTRSLRRTAKCRLELLGLIFATIILPAGFGCAAPPNATPAPVDKPFAGAWQGFISYHGGRVDIRLNLTADKGGWRGTVFPRTGEIQIGQYEQCGSLLPTKLPSTSGMTKIVRQS
jgi:hypothetical protein